MLKLFKVRRTAVVLTCVAAITAGGLMATSASAAPRAATGLASTHRSAACSRSFNPYKMPIAVLRSCGDVILPLRHVIHLPGGGKEYSYGDYTRLMPPAHFNVLRASDKQLREYGIPTRKQLGHRWYSVMRHFRRVAPPEPYLVEVPSFLVSGGASPRVCQLPSCTGNWVGHYVTGHTYKEVTVTWAEPSFTNGGCTNGEFVQWAGLGGTTSPVNLAQAGTTFNVPNFAAHEGFIETIIGGVGPMVEATQFVPSHGDSVYSSILWDSATTEYSYFMEDFTTGTVYSAHSRTDSSPDNSTAEVISERPNNPPTDLSKFQNDSFTGATSYWGTSSAGFVNNPNHYNLKMEGISGDTLATSSNLDSNSNFSNTWVACH